MPDDLQEALLEFVTALRRTGIEVILGGGYGLYLRQVALLESETRTYLPRDAWPRPRATADLDVFLPTDVVADHARMARVREALDDLQYRPVPLHYLHFAREGRLGQIRIELLTGPVSAASRDRVKVSDFRVRPRKTVQLHAYLTEEAVDLEPDPTEVPTGATVVRIPNALSFVLMKLHAFRDRMDQARDDHDRDHGRHHALDVYRLIAMLTEPDESFIRDRLRIHRHAGPVGAARRIVAEQFAGPSSTGVLRLREHSLARDGVDAVRFVEMLGALFGGADEA